MISWLRQHGLALVAALSHMRKSPGGFLFNIIVVAIALALPFAGLTLLDNVRPMADQLSVDPELSLFVKPGTPRDDAVALAGPIRTVLADRNFTRVKHATILEILRGHGSLEYAMDAARAYAEAARQSIVDLPQPTAEAGRALRALLWVPGYVTDRDR